MSCSCRDFIACFLKFLVYSICIETQSQTEGLLGSLALYGANLTCLHIPKQTS